jgi:hypothetical protein
MGGCYVSLSQAAQANFDIWVPRLVPRATARRIEGCFRKGEGPLLERASG